MAKDYCAHCGKELNGHGLVFDDIDIFCDEKCAAEFFDNDLGCVEILIDDGRLVWED